MMEDGLTLSGERVNVQFQQEFQRLPTDEAGVAQVDVERVRCLADRKNRPAGASKEARWEEVVEAGAGGSVASTTRAVGRGISARGSNP